MTDANQAFQETCCWKFINTRAGRFFKFFVLLFLGVINLVVDWFFYTKVELIQPGLVYGPPHERLRLIIFICCVIATIGFFIEVLHNLDDLSKKRKIRLLTLSLTNFIQIYFEDLPLLILNLLITACHDGQPTMIAVIKSTVCIVMFVIRFILMIAYRCFVQAKRSRSKSVLDILSTIGLVLTFLISVKIQLLRIFPTHSNGGFMVADPMQFTTMNFATYKYLDKVAIYTKWPIENGRNSSEITSDLVDKHYLWLADITDVIDNTFLSINLQTNYNSVQDNFTVCITKKSTKECFLFDGDSGYFSYVSPDKVSIDAGFEAFEMTITKEPAQLFKYSIGYLDYNLNKFVSFKNKTTRCMKAKPDHLIYAKYLPFSESESNAYLKKLGSTFSFYDGTLDLLPVKKLWKTGILGCQMSGDLGPKLNEQLKIRC